MNELSYSELLQIHQATLIQHGGLPGVKDEGSLLSALAQPAMSFGGADLYPTLWEKAAALGFSLVKNHAFNDGNKRVSFIAMRVFLARNGYTLEVPEPEVISFMLALAAGQVEREELVGWLAEHLEPVGARAQVLTAEELEAREAVAIDAVDRITVALIRINAVTMTYAELFGSFGLKLNKHSAKIDAIALGPKVLVVSQMRRVSAAASGDVTALSMGLKRDMPIVRKSVKEVEECVPSVVEALNLAQSEKTRSINTLIQLGLLTEKIDSALNAIEGFQEGLNAMKKADPSLGTACKKLADTMDELRSIYNQNWFSYRELALQWKNKL